MQRYSRLPKGIGRGNPGAGNGIFGCRDGRLKIGLRDRKYHQRPKERNDTGENPRRNGLFGADPEICGLEGLGGGGSRAQTGDPPPSHRTGLRRRAGNGNLRCRDGHAKADLSPSRDQSRDARECKKPPFRRNKCEKACGSLSPTTGNARQPNALPVSPSRRMKTMRRWMMKGKPLSLADMKRERIGRIGPYLSRLSETQIDRLVETGDV